MCHKTKDSLEEGVPEWKQWGNLLIFKPSVLKLFVWLYCCFVTMGVMGGNCCGLARYQTVITLGELERDSKYAKYTQIQNILNIRTQYASKPDTLGELEPAKRYKIYSIYSLPDTAYRFKVMFFRNRFDSGRCCTFHDKHRQHMDSVRKGHVFRIFCRRRKKHKSHISSMPGSWGLRWSNPCEQ